MCVCVSSWQCRLCVTAVDPGAVEAGIMVPLFGVCELRLDAEGAGAVQGGAGVELGGQEARGSLWEHQYPLGIKSPAPALIPLRRYFIRGQLSLAFSPAPSLSPSSPQPLTLSLFMLNSWVADSVVVSQGHWKEPSQEQDGCGYPGWLWLEVEVSL